MMRPTLIPSTRWACSRFAAFSQHRYPRDDHGDAEELEKIERFVEENHGKIVTQT